MRKAKSYKIILLIIAFMISVITAFTMISVKTAKASTVKPSAYFGYKSTTTAEFTETDGAVFTLTANDTIEIKNTVAVNDFLMNYEIDANIESVKLIITANSYITNGNKHVDGKTFDTNIVNEVVVNADGSAMLNSEELTGGAPVAERKIKMQVDENGYYKASVNGTNYTTEDNAYYRVKTSNDYFKLTGKVKVEVTLVENAESAVFKIRALSQKASEDSYLQSFSLTNDALVEANPIVCLTEDVKVVGNQALIYNVKTKINYNAYSFLNGNNKNSTKLNAPNGEWLGVKANGDQTGEVHFTTDGVLEIVNKNDAEKYLTINFKVIAEDNGDKTAPSYTDNPDALEAFIKALEKKYVADDKGTDSKEDDIYVALGTSIEIPSLEDLVSDNYTAYKNLKTEIHYATPSSLNFSTKSEMKLTLNEAGVYTFYVLFKDAEGNITDEEGFVKEVDGQLQVQNSKYVFSFYVEDNAPIVITPAAQQGKGYKGASYTASRFIVDASGCNITYKLYYNADINATKTSSGWVEIPASSKVTDTEYDKDGYTYDDVKAIGYNGVLSFTPDKVGAYMIECTAISKTTARENSANSEIIKIVDEPVVVTPPSEWLQNNVWSVVFLSVGTLCLIGIIVLLCIKPKEENDN